MTLVQIAYNTVNSFNLSEDDKQQLIAMLQGNEVKERAKQKLKVPTKEQIEMQKMEKLLIKNHFKSQNGKNLY
ncbi:hypothetical protein CAPN008_22870 [Capnocytophaga canis]|uniref:hypothetical protein n=1 Tax=Capnocytophaga canis TaxID=1848903 RepID=UPI001ACBBC8C|nr:hypothetical protein [Capnocytophaga canis]GIM62237.1 hypothetical protein CAPN008_22870 [Capnocytophaga canis]